MLTEHAIKLFKCVYRRTRFVCFLGQGKQFVLIEVPRKPLLQISQTVCLKKIFLNNASNHGKRQKDIPHSS